MLSGFSVTNLLVTLFTFFVTYAVFTLYIRPYYRVLYYKRQGLHTFFNIKLLPFFGWWKDAKRTGDFFYKHRQLLIEKPQTKAIAENFLSYAIVKLHDPEMIKELLRKYEIYHKDQSFTGLLYDLGNGTIVQIEGPEWKKRRKMLSSAFNFEFLKDTIPMIIEVAQTQFAQWVNDGELTNQNIVEKMSLITGGITGRFMFGKRFEDQKINGVSATIAVQRLLVDIMEASISLPNILFGVRAIHANILPKHQKLNAEIANMRAVCKKMIDEEAKMDNKEEKNMIRLLLDLRSSENLADRLTDDDITGEFIGFFTAGTDTTSHLIGSAIYFLWKYPHVLEQVRKEVDREFSDLSKIGMDNLNRMDYTVAFLKESLRLGGPVAGLFDRIATQDDDLCGMKIKKGTMMNIFMDYLYTSEDYFSRPKEFIPERWLDDPEFAKDGYRKETYSFIPFSAGPRNCIGQHLALIEARVIIALFLKTFDFSFAEDFKFVLVLRFLFETMDPLLVTLRPKN